MVDMFRVIKGLGYINAKQIGETVVLFRNKFNTPLLFHSNITFIEEDAFGVQLSLPILIEVSDNFISMDPMIYNREEIFEEIYSIVAELNSDSQIIKFSSRKYHTNQRCFEILAKAFYTGTFSDDYFKRLVQYFSAEVGFKKLNLKFKHPDLSVRNIA